MQLDAVGRRANLTVQAGIEKTTAGRDCRAATASGTGQL